MIRAVHGGMTTDAFSARCKTQSAVRHIRRLWINVALQTKETPLAAQEQHPADASMRRMTGDATFHLDRSMLEYEGAPLFCVATDATLPICLFQHWLVARSVGVVAVGAFHLTFGHAVMRRQYKLRFDRPVTGIAKIGLWRPQQTICQPASFLVLSRLVREELRLRYFLYLFREGRFDQVRRVTGLTRYSIEIVFRAIEMLLILAGRVTREALLRVFRRRTIKSVN